MTVEHEIIPALREAYDHAGPALVDIRISKDAEAPHEFPGSARKV